MQRINGFDFTERKGNGIMSLKKVKLAELYEVHNGLSKYAKFFGSGYPFLTFSTVFNNFFIPDELVDLVQSTDKEQDNFSIKRGDIFITRTSETADELGMSCVALKDYPKATYNGFTKRMRPINDEVVWPEYIGYYMRTPQFRNKFQAFSTMTTRASLRNEDLLSLEVELPNMEEQKRIACVLKAYDDLIQNNKRQLCLLEEAVQRLYDEWFVKFHFKGHEKCVFENGFPSNWKRDRADVFFNIAIGKTPPRAEKQWFVDGNKGCKWISISDMGKAGTYVFETSEGLTSEAVSKHNMKVCPQGTVLVSFKLTVGRVAITTEDMCTNEAIAHFYIDDDVKRTYAYLYLKCFKYDTLGNTSSISKAVNSKIIKAMPFLMPDDKVLGAFSRATAPYFSLIYKKQQEIIKAKEARDRLLPKLMNGENEV